jgi:hypothetical protein
MRIAIAAAVVLAVALTTSVVAPAVQAHDSQVSFDFFYSNLSPHGSWLVSAEFGRVWQPRNYAAGWNPYYDGHWASSDVGWVWVSDYQWGAIPYHYGTWVPDPALGWVWVPGYTWAPAWVVFRTGPDAIGWAPVAPGFSVGVSFGASAPVSGSFVFVSTRDFAAPRIRSCVIPEARTKTIIHNTTIVNSLKVENHVVVNRGPSVRVVERASGRKIRSAPIETFSRVAPFPSVNRSQLAVMPDRTDRGVRAAEPVSAKRPLPESNSRASTGGYGSRHSSRDAPPAAEGPRRDAPPPPQAKESPREAPAHGSSAASDRPRTSKKQPAKQSPKQKKDSEKTDKKHDGGQGGSDE